jgi:hypothetical protein
MDCQQAQHDLLSAESLGLLAPVLAAHLAECPECKAMLEQLRRLEAHTKQLPMPAGHEKPSPEFLRQIAAIRPGQKMRRLVRRAIAAAVVLAFGLAAISLIFFNGSEVQADVLIGQLVQWNLQIVHSHSAADRTRIYQQHLTQLQRQIAHSHLAPADHALANSLMDNAHWLTTENNAAEESQHFRSIANQLLARQQASNSGAAAHFEQIYQELMTEGIGNQPKPTKPGSTAPSGTAQPVGPASQLMPRSVMPQPMASTGFGPIHFAIPRSFGIEPSGPAQGESDYSVSSSNRLPGQWDSAAFVHAGEPWRHSLSHISSVSSPSPSASPARTPVATTPPNPSEPPADSAPAKHDPSCSPPADAPVATSHDPHDDFSDSQPRLIWQEAAEDGSLAVSVWTNAGDIPPGGKPIHLLFALGDHANSSLTKADDDSQWMIVPTDSPLSPHEMVAALTQWIDAKLPPSSFPAGAPLFDPSLLLGDGHFNEFPDWHLTMSQPIGAPEPVIALPLALSVLMMRRRRRA